MGLRCTTISSFVDAPFAPSVEDVATHAPAVTMTVHPPCSADGITLHFRSPAALRLWLSEAIASLDDLHPETASPARPLDGADDPETTGVLA